MDFKTQNKVSKILQLKENKKVHGDFTKHAPISFTVEVPSIHIQAVLTYWKISAGAVDH